MKFIRLFLSAMSAIAAVCAKAFKKMLPYGCGHWGAPFSYVNFRFDDQRVRIVPLTQEQLASRPRCRHCTLEHLASVSRVCPNCRWPIVPGDIVCYGEFSITADLRSLGNGPFLICDSCGAGKPVAGRWLEQGLVRPDRQSAASR